VVGLDDGHRNWEIDLRLRALAVMLSMTFRILRSRKLNVAAYRLGISAALLVCSTTSAWAAVPADFKAQLAKTGAISAGQTVYQATVYCQQPPAFPIPPGVIEGYRSRAKAAFAADPTYDADFATGFGDTTIMQTYLAGLKMNAAAMQETRATACQNLIPSLPTKPHTH